eukprot:gene16843-20027_t
MGCKYGYLKELNPKFESQWATLIKRELPKAQKKHMAIREAGLNNCRRLAYIMKGEIKRRLARPPRATKDLQLRSKKLVKEMGLYWKKYEKDEREAKKRAEKEEAMARKRQEEAREAKRQQRKLNFLITQTELYSHFMSKKLAPGETEGKDAPKEDRKEEARLKEEALKISKRAVEQQLAITGAFDADVDKLRETSETLVEPETTGGETPRKAAQLDSTAEITALKQPSILNASLKAYQLKGMSWIVNLYDQGINGILADEMGLGKTIQSIAVLAHLAEEKDIWGPFLIVTPKSTLHNWKNEFARFVPSFKVLPYWGNQKQRQTIRKYWNPKKLYSKGAPFHVLVTSYNVMVLDEKYFHRIRWQYMILDEAHAIKSASSNRWKTLMSFNCRNRLLLTGTPIQNSMAELWALLHFIMPTLFDSHDEFAEWFSKDIENHAMAQGGLNEHQLNRLHLILKPFMLRRIKKDVENEMPPKREVEVSCSLTVRQRKLYQALREKITLSELLDNTFTETGMKHLMNLVMQFRKVCNHPELFERSECRSPYQFQLDQADTPAPFSDHAAEHQRVLVVVNHNPIKYQIPVLLSNSLLPTKRIVERLSLFSPLNIHTSLATGSSCFSFSRLADLSPGDLSRSFNYSTLLDMFISDEWMADERMPVLEYVFENYKHLPIATRCMLLEPLFSSTLARHHVQSSPLLNELVVSPDDRCRQNLNALQSVYRLYPKATAAPIEAVCSNRRFYMKQRTALTPTAQQKQLLFGIHNKDQSSSTTTIKTMVNYNDNSDKSIFIFLLSTRACGIGINLTAADTVIFFDSDWNPTMDEQAMDRCHRLGQLKPVTVYRLVTKGTVEEKVIKRAKQKHQIQSIVIAGGKFENEMRATEVVSFLLDDDEVEEKYPATGRRRTKPLVDLAPVADKPFSPSDIPAFKPTAKGRPPKEPKPKEPPKKKGPKPGYKRNKPADSMAAAASTDTSTPGTPSNNTTPTKELISGTTTTTTPTSTTPPDKPTEPAKKRSKKAATPSDPSQPTTKASAKGRGQRKPKNSPEQVIATAQIQQPQQPQPQ